MKKSVLKFLAVALAASTLSGCSLTDLLGGKDLPEETREFNLSLRDYSSTVIQNTTYKYDGKVYVVYKDDKSEKEVTSLCKYSTVDTSKVGKVDFRVDYQTKSYTKYTTTQLTVVEAPVLDSISLKNYTSSVKIGESYTFDGSVIANYTDKTTKVVTSSASFDYSAIKKDTVGKYPLTVSYTEGKISKQATADITVYEEKAKLTKIEAKEYTDNIEKGSTYTFDGKVIATFADKTTENVTDRCNIGVIDTSTPGTKTLTISYKDEANNITKYAYPTINVTSTLKAISSSNISVAKGRSATVSLTYEPSDATNKKVKFESNNTSIATVESSDSLTASVRGVAEGTTSIKVTSLENSSITTTFNVTVTEAPAQDEWTILLYMCGADLESDKSQGGAATDDLKEIASVSGQPEGYNIVVQAGGASRWENTYSSVISKDKCNRFHLSGKKYFSDSQTTKVNMGLQSTFQSFLEWGINTYPADKIGVILWNHGGALDGCCYDEQFNDDALTPDEAAAAFKAAKKNTGYSNKFEFIGYDCCLMQVQDIAGLNAEYANYMIASEESEWEYGWTYDGWVDDLFAKKSTENILKAIVDSFKSETTSAYQGWGDTNDQTLSYLDLSKWTAYEDAFEDFASTLTSSNWSAIKSCANSAQKFGYYEDYDAYPYDVFDVGSFLTKVKANFSLKSNATLMNKVATIESKYSELVKYEWHGSGSSGATGLSLFCPISGYNQKGTYGSSVTTLTSWRDFCLFNGTWSGGWSY